MLKFIGIFLLGIFAAMNMAQAAESDCYIFEGGAVIANNGEYLGKIANSYSADSIFNEYGTYGSEYQSKSLWNSYGSYGSEYSGTSPMNSYAAPAKIIKNGNYWELSVNRGSSILNPKVLKALCSDM